MTNIAGDYNAPLPPPSAADSDDSDASILNTMNQHNSDAMSSPPPPMFSQSPSHPEESATSVRKLDHSTTSGTPEPVPPPAYHNHHHHHYQAIDVMTNDDGNGNNPSMLNMQAVSPIDEYRPVLHRVQAPVPPPMPMAHTRTHSKTLSPRIAHRIRPLPPSTAPPSLNKAKSNYQLPASTTGAGNPPPRSYIGDGIIFEDGDTKQGQTIDAVSFTDILRQVDMGVEVTTTMKEVIRKFAKHQLQCSEKLTEIYSKYPSNYQEQDGMKEFADLCALVHQLLIETVSAQKQMSDFLFKDVVPKMTNYIADRQRVLQDIKRDNQQAEMKLRNSINSMNKASATAKQSALKAKSMVTSATVHKKKYEDPNKKKASFGSFMNKVKKNSSSGNLPEEEAAYQKAHTNQKNYEAAVMAANYEQDTYNGILARFKRQCREQEKGRMKHTADQIQTFVNAHRAFFNHDTITVLQTRILSGLDALNPTAEFDDYLARQLAVYGHKPNEAPPMLRKKFEAKKYDYQNVFHSLQDSMDITLKLTPHAKLPLILTTLCDKVRQLNGFDTEGIFRKSGMATEIERLKSKLSSNDYAIDTQDPHIVACLLKDWLRGLTDSLIPFTHYDIAIQMAKNEEIKQEPLEVFLSQLPEVNRETIKYLVKFVKEMLREDHVAKTKMNVENVAIVFAPTILKCPNDDPKILMANSRFEKQFCIALIEELNCVELHVD
mmetsp:Transcript_20355/g.32575  ORF Transcript_20355/g.32575 Transcript_20355/m.32575 type:complete len:715 (+) Transcript_20355:132-2276(+)